MSADASRKELYDVVIVGGGPAGLSAALVLGRCMRHVLLCDAGHPRNSMATIFNGYLSRDASTPAEFREICVAQLNRYDTVALRKIKVIDAERGEEKLVVTLEGGERVESRMLLLATGLVDELPRIEGLGQFYGKSAHSCPYCDGWESRGRPIAVLGGDDEAAGLAVEMLLWSKDVVLCSNGPLCCGSKILEQLQRARVKIIETPISKVVGEGEHLTAVCFEDGTALPREILFFSPKQHQCSPLAERLGCEFCPEDGCIQCGEDTATCVPGVYAAGNASRGVQLVIVAATEGTRAAMSINTALLEADASTGHLGYANLSSNLMNQAL